jgi:hypothetical protein
MKRGIHAVRLGTGGAGVTGDLSGVHAAISMTARAGRGASQLVEHSLPGANLGIPSGSVHTGAAGVFLVDGLPGHAEDLRDLLPGPAVFPGVIDLECLELLQQPAEGGDGPESGARV